MMKLALSPTAVKLYEDCPRCFYNDKVLGVKRPDGIVASLPMGMDRMLKKKYDKHRAEGTLPLEILGHVQGKLFSDQGKITTWRKWQSGLACMVGDIKLSGALDDLLFEMDERYAPFDFKTRGYPPKADTPAYSQTQMDCYGLMLEANKYPASDHAHLAYYWPKEDEEGSSEFSVFSFNSEVVTIKISIVRAMNLVQAAGECMKSETAPMSSAKCEYCSFVAGIDQLKQQAA